jgi:hypothetical protein
MSLALGYLLGLLFVGAALQHELEAKPKATAAIILFWPIALPLAWVLSLASLLRR